MGNSSRMADHEHKTTIFGRLWTWASLLGGIPVLAALALVEDSGDPKPPEPSGGPPAPPKPSGDQPFRTFADQKEFDSHAAGIKREAERNAAKALAEQLGMTVEEAKKVLTERQEAEQAKLTEVERREKAAADKEAAAAQREAEANRKARLADVSLALTTTGVRPDRVTYATNAVMADLPEDADPEAITATVAKVKEAIPEFFGEAPQGTQKPPAPHLGGPPRNNGSNGGQLTGIEAGRERSRQQAKTRPQPAEGVDPFAGLGRLVGS